MNTAAIDELARLRGVGEAFHDYRGELQHFSLATKAALLRAMGVPVDDPVALEAALASARRARWQRLVEPTVVSRPQSGGIAVVTRADEDWITLQFEIHVQDGGRHDGAVVIRELAALERQTIDGVLYVRRRLPLPTDLPLGYHRLVVRVGDHAPVETRLIAAPACCFQYGEKRSGVSGVFEHGGKRGWGIAVQLYALRSADNWGIGDFRDLLGLVERAAATGADFIGLNPLHALFPANPGHCSPYSASSRLALNVFYIQPECLPEFAQCDAAQLRFSDAAFQQQLRAARAATQVDYVVVASLKLELLTVLYRDFCSHYLAGESARGQAFQLFVAERGEDLRRQGLFDALDEFFRLRRGRESGWRNWPSEYHSVSSPAVQAFAIEQADRVQFYMWLQWVATEQLAVVQQRARELGMSIGLYNDCAVGADASGAEVWGNRDVFAVGVSIGAPPDRLALKGQDWGLPPQDPGLLEARAFEPFAALLRANMRNGGALRLDHVMALFRQWWVPAGHAARDGAYVHYPLDLLMAIIALESVTQRVVVIGEDLGVVPDEVRRAMAEFGVYQYKVLLFEKVGDAFRAPSHYEPRALATATTHDLPTLRSWWQGDDIRLRERLALYPAAEVAWELAEERRRDREQFLQALSEAQRLPAAPRQGDDPYSDSLADAAHGFLATSRAALVAVQVEDLLGMIEPVNVPGTSTEYPNWRRKLPVTIEALFARPDIDRSLRDLSRLRAI